MQAVRCTICKLLVNPNDYGVLKIAIPGNHEPVECDGFALASEMPICQGSEMLGRVVDAEEENMT